MKVIKLAVSNQIAGIVIGKGGSTLTSLEKIHECSIKVSHSNSFFPGTEDRVVLISGAEAEHVLNCLFSIISKASESDNYLQSNSLTIKVVSPNSSVSAIIGKSGQLIKELQDETNTRVQVSSREDGLIERLITISGACENVENALRSIANTVLDDPHTANNLTVSYQNGNPSNKHGFRNSSNSNKSNTPAITFNGFYNSNRNFSPDIMQRLCSIETNVNDSVAGVVIGKGGCNLTEIIRISGARVQLAPKGDYIPGTQLRKVTFSGPLHCVHIAHALFIQKVAEAEVHNHARDV